MSRKERRNPTCIGDMRIHSHGERFQALHEQPRVHRRKARTDIAQHLGARAHEVRVFAERLGEVEAMIAWARTGHERMTSGRPIEAARFHQHAGDHRAMAADELGRRVDDDVRAVFDRAAEIR